MSELLKLSACQMRQGLISGDFSSTELTQAHLDQITRTNSQLNSFLKVTEESALELAKNADQLLKKSGDMSPPLTGIPIAVKDMLLTKDVTTTCASRILENFIPPYDATAVKLVKDAGAVILGKTNLDEFAMGSSNENSAFGPVRNPWDLDRVPGGSSGGSAASLASGQAPLALGTDTGGSIRQPASFTGTCGLKPTYGRVSRYGAVAFASSLDQIGPMARCIQDLALLLSAIAGYDPKDSTSLNVEVPDYLKSLDSAQILAKSGLRIGIPREYFEVGIAPDIEKPIRSAIAKLESLGATLVDISLPTSRHALAVYYILAPAEASSNLARYDGVRYGHRATNPQNLSDMYERTRQEGFGDEVKRRILIGNYVLSTGYYDAYYRKAQQVRTLIIEDFSKAFSSDCDIIVAPAAPTTAFKLGEKTVCPMEMYLADIFTIPVNLAGLPALSLPCGRDRNGLPVGLQMIAPPLKETTLLQAAYLLEQELTFPSTHCI